MIRSMLPISPTAHPAVAATVTPPVAPVVSHCDIQRPATPQPLSLTPPPQAARSGAGPQRSPVLDRMEWHAEAQHIGAHARAQLARFGVTEAALQAWANQAAQPKVAIGAERARHSLSSLDDQVLICVLNRAQSAATSLDSAVEQAFTTAVAAADGQLLNWLTALQGLCVHTRDGEHVPALSPTQEAELAQLSTLLERARSRPTGMNTLRADCCAADAPRRQLALTALHRALALAQAHLPPSSREALAVFYAHPGRGQAIRQLRKEILAPAQALAEQVAEQVVGAIDGLAAGGDSASTLVATPDVENEVTDAAAGVSIFWPFAS